MVKMKKPQQNSQIVVGTPLKKAVAVKSRLGCFFKFPYSPLRRYCCRGLFWLLTLLFICACNSSTVPGLPPDEKLIANFQKHKSEFVLLRDMFLQDQILDRVGRTYVRPVDPSRPWHADALGLSAERVDEYRRLFDRLQIPGGMGGRRDYVYFITEGWGRAGRGHRKTYVWSPREQGPLLNDLKPERKGDHYRRIGENWYLRYTYFINYHDDRGL